VTLRGCRTGHQLPKLVNCGDVCDEWPDCLPAPSPHLLERITQFCAEGEAAGQSGEAVACTLNRLYAAITQGLKGREQ
jgi:hypothetical protein